MVNEYPPELLAQLSNKFRRELLGQSTKKPQAIKKPQARLKRSTYVEKQLALIIEQEVRAELARLIKKYGLPQGEKL